MGDSQQDVQALSQRLDQLERRMATSLETRRIIVRDREGRPALELGTSPDGEPEIALMDSEGRDRGVVRLVAGECVVELLGENGAAQARLAGSDRTARLVLWCGGGGEVGDAGAARPVRRIEMRTARDGTALLAVYDGESELRARVGITASGDAVLAMQPPTATASGSRDEASR